MKTCHQNRSFRRKLQCLLGPVLLFPHEASTSFAPLKSESLICSWRFLAKPLLPTPHLSICTTPESTPQKRHPFVLFPSSGHHQGTVVLETECVPSLSVNSQFLYSAPSGIANHKGLASDISPVTS